MYLPPEKENCVIVCLEPTIHGMAFYELGYNVISHISNYEMITDIIPYLHDRNKDIIYKYVESGKATYMKDEFTTVCKKYFDKYLEEISEQDIFSSLYAGESSSNTKKNLQCGFPAFSHHGEKSSDTAAVLHAASNSTLMTMRDWCNKNQLMGSIPGFAIYGRDISSHSKVFKFSENIFGSHHCSTQLDDLIIVYNKMHNVIFLIRKWNINNLELGMKLSTKDVMQFKLLFHDVLMRSGVTVINLLATNQEVNGFPWKCDSCKYHVIPMRSLASSDAFDEWWDKTKCNFKISFNHINVNKNFTFDFAAKVAGFLALLQYSKGGLFHGMLPSLNDATEQITETLLMTPQQLRIAYSLRKHIMIKGCYGSGKTIVALKKAEILSRSLTQDDSLYYIICESRSVLGKEIQSNLGLKVVCNERQVPASTIVEQILESDSKTGNLNLIFDEFDGGDLDEIESKKLNHKFTTNERLKYSSVILIPRVFKKERGMNDNKKKRNPFEMLQTMNPPEELTCNMRNTVEIDRLVKATWNAFEDPHTVCFYPALNRIEIEESKSAQVVENETYFTVPHLNEGSTGSSCEVSKVKKVKIKSDENYENSRSLIGKSSASSIKRRKLEHLQSNNSGSSIKSELPSLYEVPDNTKLKIHLSIILRKVLSETEKGIQLDILNIKDLTDMKVIEKHVILHFDERHDKTFDAVFSLLGISEKITSEYNEFKNDKDKTVFWCNYRVFRGLQYPRVIVVLDCSLSFSKHFLPESLSRCTANLHIIVLNGNYSFVNWRHGIILSMWKKFVKGCQPLLKQWKIEIFDPEESHAETSQLPGSETPEQGRIRISSNVYTELEEIVGTFSTVKREKCLR